MAGLMRDTRLEVDLDAIGHNFRQVVSILEGTHVPRPAVAAVLKADAYGLGAITVAGRLIAEGADMLAVACLPEAIELRRHFPEAEILVMGHTPDSCLAEAVRQHIACTIFDASQARMLSVAAVTLGTEAAVHIKVDTGMNRLGLKPDSGTPGLLASIASMPGLSMDGIFTHLALVDEASDKAQFSLFETVMAEATKLGIHFKYRHVCDSIGLVRYPEFRMDLVRVGAVLFGMAPLRTSLSTNGCIKTPFALRSRISRIRRLAAGEGVGYDYTWRAPESGALLATVPAGYVDGYRRCMGNRASVLIQGARAPVVGLVCMDQCNVDVSSVPGVKEGDEVLLLGAGPEGEVPVLEMASWAGTNRNEIISTIGRRVPRVYREGGQVVRVVDYLLD